MKVTGAAGRVVGVVDVERGAALPDRQRRVAVIDETRPEMSSGAAAGDAEVHHVVAALAVDEQGAGRDGDGDAIGALCRYSARRSWRWGLTSLAAGTSLTVKVLPPLPASISTSSMLVKWSFCWNDT